MCESLKMSKELIGVVAPSPTCMANLTCYYSTHFTPWKESERTENVCRDHRGHWFEHLETLQKRYR